MDGKRDQMNGRPTAIGSKREEKLDQGEGKGNETAGRAVDALKDALTGTKRRK